MSSERATTAGVMGQATASDNATTEDHPTHRDAELHDITMAVDDGDHHFHPTEDPDQPNVSEEEVEYHEGDEDKEVDGNEEDEDVEEMDPKGEDDVIAGFRRRQKAVTDATRAARRLVADVKEAKETGMSVARQAELRKEFQDLNNKALQGMKLLNAYKEEAKTILDKSVVDNRALTFDPTRSGGRNPLLFAPGDFDRAKEVALVKAGRLDKETFSLRATKALFDSMMDLNGADPDAAKAIRRNYTDPDAVVEYEGALEAVASVTNKAGGPVFVAGSLVEQHHRAINHELYGELLAVKVAEADLGAALTAAAVLDTVEKVNQIQKSEKAVVKKPRNARSPSKAAVARPMMRPAATEPVTRRREIKKPAAKKAAARVTRATATGGNQRQQRQQQQQGQQERSRRSLQTRTRLPYISPRMAGAARKEGKDVDFAG